MDSHCNNWLLNFNCLKFNMYILQATSNIDWYYLYSCGILSIQIFVPLIPDILYIYVSTEPIVQETHLDYTTIKLMFSCLSCLRSEHLLYILSVFCCKSLEIYFIAVDPVCPTHMLAPLLQLSENSHLQTWNIRFHRKSGSQCCILKSLISTLWKELL